MAKQTNKVFAYFGGVGILGEEKTLSILEVRRDNIVVAVYYGNNMLNRMLV